MSKPPSTRLSKSLANIKIWAGGGLTANLDAIENYIRNKERLAVACDEIFLLGKNEIGASLKHTPDQSRLKQTNRLAAGILKVLIADSMIIRSLLNSNSTGIDDLDNVTHIMFCALATGQFAIIEPFHRAVFAGINGGYGIEDGHNLPLGTTLRYAAFGLAIIGDWLGKPLDLDKHALPRDPAWGQLVAHWREPDPEKLLPILMAACDTHVERIALNSRELDSGNFEFGSPFEAVYPAEILAILNLRRSLKLANPFIDHPLMTTPYAALTCPPGTRLDEDELLERFLIAVCKYNPEAMPEGLYEAILPNPPVRGA
ncbi:hypothetical protein N5E96_17020 [Pseudomonas mosselii]|uniref:hypothetical protein n=1 Tax=Pseudomonas mosselii TaxID=78327 RepID=UPI00244D3D59|nr:hypothetical protein [Pseudomonas mosselii]MDH1659597.1 hypothetical protein [Pseudomonas mosselii]MDH1718037.1 hypothetical protein [Pseudomonas mosselii]MDH1722982.1 hypothetical protein [Pseudomonas mosselii]MDN4499297.1 hypothetical protein [Pseudomonas mosselii]MEB5934615.1 hypothetical protein [Pseudomonas mosselii]